MHARAGALAFSLVLAFGALAPSLASAQDASDGDGANLRLSDPVTVNAAAVAQTEEGLVGSVATISISVASNGSGHVFMDTVPLTQVDMQGSARLAVKIAGRVTGLAVEEHDFFFVVRSGSTIIGGPSAGGIMTAGTIAALKGWAVNRSIMMTGTINPDGSIGPVGGVPEKAKAAADVGATLFLFPEGQETAVLGGRVVQMSEYCRDELAITCAPVRDAEEATRIVTGHEFVTPEIEGDVTNDEYQAVLAPLAQDARARAESRLERARSNLTNSSALTASVRNELRASVTKADGTLGEAQGAERDGSYYTAVSKYFQTAIEGRYVESAVGFFEAPDADRYTTRLLAEAEREVQAAVDASRAARPADETSMQAIGSAQTRATEAENLLGEAREGFRGAAGVSGYLAALYQTSFAVERARTVHWWLSIGDAFGTAGAVVTRERLEEIARESIETAEEIVTYGEVVLQEAGAPSSAIAEARELLTSAREDHENGFFAAALYEAIEAEVRGGLALELLGYTSGVPSAKVDLAREEAERAILEARERGAEPILALSYYEFAGSLREPDDALAFYHLARTVARLSDLVRGTSAEPRPSRFVGDAGIPRASLPLAATDATAFLALGVAGGAALALLATLARSRPRPPPVLPAAPPPPTPPYRPPESAGFAPQAPPPSEPWTPRGP